MCVRMCVCARACVRVCVRVWTCVRVCAPPQSRRGSVVIFLSPPSTPTPPHTHIHTYSISLSLSDTQRRSRGKKEVKNLLDSGLLAHAFPNVSRYLAPSPPPPLPPVVPGTLAPCPPQRQAKGALTAISSVRREQRDVHPPSTLNPKP